MVVFLASRQSYQWCAPCPASLLGLTLADVVPDVHLQDLDEIVHPGGETPLLPAVDAHPRWKTQASRSLVIMEGRNELCYGCHAKVWFR